MFDKKYVFETRGTRFSRHLKGAIIFIFVSCLLYFGFACSLIIVSANETKFSENALDNNPPDLIVVFTGAKGRIPYAFTKAEEYRLSHIFISGVYDRNSVETIITPNLSNKVNADLFEIDYSAKNTIENVKSTSKYLDQKKGYRRILIISHDYHIPRIRLLLNHISNLDSKHTILYSGVKSNYFDFENIKIILSEVYKFAGALIYCSRSLVNLHSSN